MSVLREVGAVGSSTLQNQPFADREHASFVETLETTGLGRLEFLAAFVAAAEAVK